MSAGAVPAVRAAAACGWLVYVIGAAAVLLSNDSDLAARVIADTGAILTDRGAPGWTTQGDRVQMMLNALLFAPVAGLAALAIPSQPLSLWVALAFVASGGVELWQAFVLQPRAAEYVDVVSNTLGGLTGSMAAAPGVLLLRARAGLG